MNNLYLSPESSISKCIASLDGSDTIIHLADGVYTEKLLIDKPNVTFTGASREGTVISYGDFANKLHTDGKEYNTFRTYTVNVIADNVRFENLTIENTSKNPKEKGQAVALSLYANNISVKGCNLKSMQDTVFNGPLPTDLIERYIGFLPDRERVYDKASANQYFADCLIEGSVDFIFGCGNALYYNCEICSVFDGRGTGYVAAPAHAQGSEDSLCFINCRFTNDGVADNSIFLARPWRDYGKAVFINSVLGSHISVEGFDKWNDTDRDKTARFYEYGSGSDGRVSWTKALSDKEAEAYIRRAEAYFLK